MSRQVLKIEPNQLYTLQLAYPDGISVAGHYGPQVKFTLQDQTVIYLDRDQAEQIRALKLGPGEAFTLEKCLEPGQRIRWEIRRVGRLEALQAIRPASPSVIPAESRPAQSNPVSGPATPSLQSKQPLGTGTNGAALQTRPQLRTAPIKPNYEEAFRECIRIVQDVLAETGEQWSDQSRQAMVSTLIINAARENAIRFTVREKQA